MLAKLAVLAITAVGLVLIQRPAAAADIPGDASTTATLKVEVINYGFTINEFEKRNDSDWYRVSLEKGKDYFVAVNGNSDECAVAGYVRNAKGKILKSGSSDLFVDEGFEFRAPSTGTYFVEYKPFPAGCFKGFFQHFNHYVRVSTDCASGIATTCVQSVGQSRKSMLAGAYDQDWFKASLLKSKTYTITATQTAGAAEFTVGIADASGKVLATDSDEDFDEVYQIKGFRPKADGVYHLFVYAADDFGTVYQLSLKTP